MKQPADLPDDQLFLLRIVWETFRVSDGNWPDIDDLQRRLDISGMDHRNVREITQKIPRNLLHVDRYSWHGPLRLTVEGLTYCNDANDLLELVPRFVTLCVDRYRESASTPPQASMSRTEVAGRLGLLPMEELRPKRLLQQLYLLMHEETYIYGGGHESAEGDWVFHIRMENIREFLHVTSLKQYLETVARLDPQFRHELGSAPAAPHSAPSTTAVSPVRSLLSAVSRSIQRGASDAISQATKSIVLVVLVILAVGILAIAGLKAPITLPILPETIPLAVTRPETSLSQPPAGLLPVLACDSQTVALWALRDGARTTATECNGHTGEITNGTWLSDGYASQLEFNGKTSIVVRNAADFDLPQFTIEVYVWPTSEQAQGIVARAGGAEQRFHLGLRGRQIEFKIDNNPAITEGILALNRWSHIAATFDGTTMRIWLNGRLVREQIHGRVIPPGQGSLVIGKNVFDADYLEGRLQYLRISRGARTSFPAAPQS